MGKFLCDSFFSVSVWLDYFSLSRCHLVLLGLSLLPGSEKENLTQQELIWLSLLFTGASICTILSFSNMSWIAWLHKPCQEKSIRNIQEMHLLRDQDISFCPPAPLFFFKKAVGFFFSLLVYILHSISHSPHQVFVPESHLSLPSLSLYSTATSSSSSHAYSPSNTHSTLIFFLFT